MRSDFQSIAMEHTMWILVIKFSICLRNGAFRYVTFVSLVSVPRFPIAEEFRRGARASRGISWSARARAGPAISILLSDADIN